MFHLNNVGCLGLHVINKYLVELFLAQCSGFSIFMSVYICNSQWTPGWSYICYDFNTFERLKI